MAQIVLLVSVLGWAVMVYGLWRAGVMFAGWKPTPAMVMKSDYTDIDQWQDRWMAGSYTMFSGKRTMWDDENTRVITDEIVYTPADGRKRHALVSRRVVRAWFTAPDAAYVVWYDEADQDKVKVNGPFYWCWVALVGGAVLGMSIHALVRLGGLSVAIAQLIGHH